MTPLTQYIINRETNDHELADVQIYDSTSYAAYQVYVDDAQILQTTAKTFTIVFPVNKKIDVLGLASNELGSDFSASLNDANPDKVLITIPDSYSGLTVNVYGDNGTGTIDYGRPILTGLVMGENGLGWVGLTDPQWISLDSWATMPDVGGTSLQFGITQRLESGSYKFAIVNTTDGDYYHAPYIATATVASRPDEITPSIAWYEPTTDSLAFDVGSAASGAFNCYAGPFGGNQTTVSQTSPFATVGAPVIFQGLRGSTNFGFRWLLIRRVVGGIEEKNWNWVLFTVEAGNWVGNGPPIIIVNPPPGITPPVNITATTSEVWREE